jgi:NADPH:quinone reductase-like Zn-dependent oxidoreductase
MHAAPINPNDLMFLEGSYEVKKSLPVVPGFEGSGTVVATGGGPVGRYLHGRRVACLAGDGDGAWAEYMCADTLECAPLRRRTPMDQGAMLLTNPVTAWVLFARARRDGRGAFEQNAAAGALGRMLGRLAARHEVMLVNIVRRDDQADQLRAAGAEHVVVSSSPDFADELGELCRRFEIRFGIDAVGGEATGRMLEALVAGGSVMVYGKLAGQPCRIDPDELLFRRKRVFGFTMYQWLESTSLLGQLRALRAAQRRLGDDLRTEVRAKLPLGDYEEALSLARSGTSDGKILFQLDE